MGAGGAVFVNSASDVVMDSVDLVNNQAVGGNGSATVGTNPQQLGGGGGLGGNGGKPSSDSNGGGGGIFGSGGVGSDSAGGTARPDHAGRVAALYREHHGALVALLQCRLNSRADAQEIAQEVYVKLLAMGDLQHIDSPRAFLFRMATNLSVDYLRKRAVRSGQ